MASVGVTSAGADIFSSLSTNNLNDFMNLLKSYPRATDETNMALLEQYRNGDENAKNLLVKMNLRLVVSQAARLKTTTCDLLDIIQDGVLGLLEAIDDYNGELVGKKFFNYAKVCVRNSIIDALQTANDVRYPSWFIRALIKYRAYETNYLVSGKKLPDTAQICADLKITRSCLDTIRKSPLLNMYRLDSSVYEDGEPLENCIPSEESEYDDIENTMLDHQILVALKFYLSPYYYYILYNRILRKEPCSQEDIANAFHLKRNTISAMEKKCLSQLKQVLLNQNVSELKIPEEYAQNIDRINEEPINPEMIVKYLFYRDILSEQEQKIFKLLITSPYKPSISLFSKILGMKEEDYKTSLYYLEQKITIKNGEEASVYEMFKNMILDKYKSRIYDVDLDMDLSGILTDAKYVATIWDNFSYGEVMEIVEENQILLTPRMEKLLIQYFDGEREKFSLNAASKRKASREINAILFGFHKKNEVTITGLYDALNKNKHRFTLDQYDYLMSRKFHGDNLRERGIISVSGLGELNELSRRLEKIHYGISRYRELNFTKAKYESIRSKCLKVLSNDKIAILDMYYGIESPKYSIQQIADKSGKTYEEVHAKLQEAKRCALRIYLGRNNTKVIEESLYIPYILDESIDLSDEARTMLREFLIEKKSYEEIEAIHGIDKKKKNQQRKVASIIASGLLKIDYYRFGIFKANDKYTTEECREIFKSLTWTDEERKVIQMKFDGKSKEEIMSETKLTFIRVSYILNKFYRLCDEHKVSSVIIDESDIRREVKAHISEKVLNEKERLMLAKLYGISCDVNPTGKRYSEAEFRQEHPNMSKQYKKIFRNALDTVRSKKAGFTRASLSYMSRDDLNLSLKDPRIPISQKEREILYYSFELNGYPYKTLKELGEIFDELPASLKSRIERTFVTIYKYENDELPSAISYEYDVEPYLRYFSKSDQEVLKDFYKNKLTFEEIGRKHNLTKGQVESLTLSLDSYLRDIVDEETTGYDFDYFWDTIDSPEIPFYGDKDKAKRVFYLYYEERLSASEIVEKLGLTCDDSVVLKVISNLMIAVSKYREGIKRVKSYTQEEIVDYYARNNEVMSLEHRQIYQKYFERLKEESKESNLSSYSQPNVPADILLDLIEENHDNVFSFEKTSREEALAFIVKHREINKSTCSAVLRAYCISPRDLMSGSEKMKVLRFLTELNIKHKVLVLRKAA